MTLRPNTQEAGGIGTTSMSGAEERMAEHFYGYGRWSAPYWFIGPEQGQGQEESHDLTRRARAWELEGERQVVDLAKYHDRLKPQLWTGARTSIQPTWRKLMLILHSYAGQPLDKESLRSYQRSHLGREFGETCLLELGGLPANSSKMQRDRTRFRETRINRIKRELAEQEPIFAVLYGKAQHRQYEAIAGLHLDLDEITWKGMTAILFTKHPSARGLSDKHWCDLGYKLSAALNERRIQRNA